MNKILTLIVAVCIVFVIVGLLPVHGEAQIYDNVLRLHVLANSDSEQDQALKLCVRDKIISLMNELCADCSTLEMASARVEDNIDLLRQCAQDEVVARGYEYGVEVALCEEEYPTKTYASLCFPSGKYLSLQVRIGEAQGQNWWCVLFPPLCLEAASKQQTDEDAFISVGLTKDQYSIITETDSPTYEARFKLLELIGKKIK